MTDTLSRSSALPGDVIFSAPLSKPDKGQLGYWVTHWMKSSVAIVSAHGDIDSTNACALAEYSLADLKRCRGLILDLTRLEFFGAEGFSALHRISVGCARAEIDWVLVPGAAVSILLRVCDRTACCQPPLLSVRHWQASTIGARWGLRHRQRDVSRSTFVSKTDGNLI